MTNPSPVITLDQISKQFNGFKAVDQLSLQIEAGQIFGLLGANGSGKTTTLKILCGLLRPDCGDGCCLGLDLRHQIKQIQSFIGYMPQQFCLYQHLSVYENLDFIGRIYGLNQRKQRLEGIIELLSLGDKQNQIAGTLSGGWQKRLALAAALLHQPAILLLDEPTTGLDPQSRLLIWDYIQSLAQQKVTVVLSTHYMDEAERCHELAYLTHGRLMIQGSSTQIIQGTGLHTWQVQGDNLNHLKDQISNFDPDLQLIEKGRHLRISSTRSDLLNLFGTQKSQSFEAVPTSLEDALIYKINQEQRRT